MILGVLYLLVALIAFYGAHGIFNEILERVTLFTKLYFYSIVYFVIINIISLISLSIRYKRECGKEVDCNGFFVQWLLSFIIGLIINVSIIKFFFKFF